MKGSRRALASERIALRLLEEMGYTTIETHKKIVINGVEVSEVDAIVKDRNGDIYAVEIKSGRIDVQGIRQAYTNALLVNAKPMVVGRGFSDDAARELAENLGVKVIELEDLFLVDPAELELLIYKTAAEAVAEVIHLLFNPRIPVKPGELQILAALSSSGSLHEAAESLNKDIEEIVAVVRRLKELTPIARTGYAGIQLVSRLLLIKAQLQSLLDEARRLTLRLDEALSKLEEALRY
ncbi:MAG: restriction endonuclease [Thermoproteota archaeon]